MAIGKRFCERCRQEISAGRLEALPDTLLCIECSRQVGGEFELRVVPENLAKSNSLKKNYGSYTIRKKRRRIDPRTT